MFAAIEQSVKALFKSAHMVHNQKKYTINGTKVAALYLMMIFKECEVGTASSVAVLRAKL